MDAPAEFVERWGLLGPGALPSSRRTRTLGLARAVRHYNNLAVPGLGGLWFGKQLVLSLLGIRVAELARDRTASSSLTNIVVTNAVEALACWLSLNQKRWAGDARLRGREKMQQQNLPTFAQARQPSFYVSQPMRQGTIQALPALGLTASTGERFNSFKTTALGKILLEMAFKDYMPGKKTVEERLFAWVQGSDRAMSSDALLDAVGPDQPLNERARNMVRDRLSLPGNTEVAARRDAQRRHGALWWVHRIARKPLLAAETGKPAEISEDHWLDLELGRAFAVARADAYALLDCLEDEIYRLEYRFLPLDGSTVKTFTLQIEKLRESAASFLELANEHSTHEEAKAACREWNGDDALAVMRSLVGRDDRVLRLRGDRLVLGPAADLPRPAQEVEGDEAVGGDGTVDAPSDLRVNWPEGTSPRIANLLYLAEDLDGRLERWL